MTTRAFVRSTWAAASCAALSVSLVGACGAEAPLPRGTALEHGRAVYMDRAASPSEQNPFACSTCHAAEAGEGAGLLLPGAPLAGVTGRPTFWAGQEDDLLRAINACRTSFMGARDAWTRDDEEAKVLYGYLASLQGDSRAVAFSVVRNIEDVAPGDPSRGAAVYSAACASCHGLRETGLGAIAPRAPLLPQQTLEEHAYLATPRERRLVFVEKVRHGVFLGYSGTMPPFSREVLSDTDLGALLAYLGVY